MEISKEKENEILGLFYIVSAVFSYFNRSIRIIFNGVLASVQNKQGTAVATAPDNPDPSNIFVWKKKKKKKKERFSSNANGTSVYTN